MQFLMTWNPAEAYRVTKDIALRLAYGGFVVRSHMEGDIKVIDEFNLSHISLIEVPFACKECGYPAFGCPFISGSEACAIRRKQWVKSDAC